jgi:hypothetical protein
MWQIYKLNMRETRQGSTFTVVSLVKNKLSAKNVSSEFQVFENFMSYSEMACIPSHSRVLDMFARFVIYEDCPWLTGGLLT